MVGEASKSDSKGPVRAGRHPPLPTSYNPPGLWKGRWEQWEQLAGQIWEETRGSGDRAREEKVKIVKKRTPSVGEQGVKKKKKNSPKFTCKIKKKKKSLALGEDRKRNG